MCFFVVFLPQYIHINDNYRDIKVEAMLNYLNDGGDVNARDNLGRALLHYAEDEKSVRILIEAGADVNAKDDYNKTPFFTVYSSMRSLVNEGVDTIDVGVRNALGRTPLFYAASVEVAQKLIERGADVNAEDNYGKTPLHEVVNFILEKGYELEVAQVLIEEGAEINAKGGEYDRTPLFYASSAELARLLIEEGAEVNVRDIFENTPLYHLVEDIEVVQVFIENGSDVNIRGPFGATPLFRVVCLDPYNAAEIVKTLINADADVNLSLHGGRDMPLECAKLRNNEEVVRRLREAGAEG